MTEGWTLFKCDDDRLHRSDDQAENCTLRRHHKHIEDYSKFPVLTPSRRSKTKATLLVDFETAKEHRIGNEPSVSEMAGHFRLLSQQHPQVVIPVSRGQLSNIDSIPDKQTTSDPHSRELAYPTPFSQNTRPFATSRSRASPTPGSSRRNQDSNECDNVSNFSPPSPNPSPTRRESSIHRGHNVPSSLADMAAGRTETTTQQLGLLEAAEYLSTPLESVPGCNRDANVPISTATINASPESHNTSPPPSTLSRLRTRLTASTTTLTHLTNLTSYQSAEILRLREEIVTSRENALVQTQTDVADIKNVLRRGMVVWKGVSMVLVVYVLLVMVRWVRSVEVEYVRRRVGEGFGIGL